MFIPSTYRQEKTAVKSLNREGIEVVNMTENGAPGDTAWSNMYIVGRLLREQLE